MECRKSFIGRIDDYDNNLDGFKNGEYVFVTPRATDPSYPLVQNVIRVIPGVDGEHSGLWWSCELRPATDAERMEARLLGI